MPFMKKIIVRIASQKRRYEIKSCMLHKSNAVIILVLLSVGSAYIITALQTLYRHCRYTKEGFTLALSLKLMTAVMYACGS